MNTDPQNTELMGQYDTVSRAKMQAKVLLNILASNAAKLLIGINTSIELVTSVHIFWFCFVSVFERVYGPC